MALSPGSTLFNGQYEILRQLGRGGFGFVYLARDTLLGEEVAIKELIPALVGDEVILRRFLAEAKATMRLTHKRIVRTHNVFGEGGEYYIIMEYMSGGSLEARLQERGPLPVDEAVRIAAQVCDGLECAHEEGVVHCDLKPANVLFDAQGRAKVADFGIAHVSDQMLSRSWLTPAGFAAGTLPYMSPEQADGVRDDPRVDIYALGAVLYRMLIGRTYLEFDQRDTPGAQADNVLRIRSQEPALPSAHDPRVPAWLDAVILKALAKRPADRYASLEELRAALLRREPAAASAQPELAPPRPAPAAPPQSLPVKPAPVQPTPAPPPAHRHRLVSATPQALGMGQAGQAPAATPERQPPVVPRERPVSRAEAPKSRLVLLGVIGGLLLVTALMAAALTVRKFRERAPGAASTPEPTAGVTAPVTLPSGADRAVMVYVPAGEFLMGSTDADAVADSGEKPQHTVYLDAFWIDKTEVTNARYKQCVDAGTCRAPTTCDTGDPAYGDSSKADHPVVCVSWDDARAYCQWAGARLPTEAEWEKAARGTGGRKYPWGNDAPTCGRANYRGGTDPCVGQPTAVGSYPTGASPYGALDMAGNVWEWVNDWYDENYYAISLDRNPNGRNSGQSRVLRGGSYHSLLGIIRAAYRNYGDPMGRHSYIGFRCVAAELGG